MPNTRWTTDEEYDFLHKRMPSWLEHRSIGDLAHWSRQVFHEWVEQFGLAAITEEDLKEADGDRGAARKAKRIRMRRVSPLTLHDTTHTHGLYSVCTNGFSTIPQPGMTTRRVLSRSQTCSSELE